MVTYTALIACPHGKKDQAYLVFDELDAEGNDKRVKVICAGGREQIEDYFRKNRNIHDGEINYMYACVDFGGLLRDDFEAGWIEYYVQDDRFEGTPNGSTK
jgi:hypothetical protein